MADPTKYPSTGEYAFQGSMVDRPEPLDPAYTITSLSLVGSARAVEAFINSGAANTHGLTVVRFAEADNGGVHGWNFISIQDPQYLAPIPVALGARATQEFKAAGYLPYKTIEEINLGKAPFNQDDGVSDPDIMSELNELEAAVLALAQKAEKVADAAERRGNRIDAMLAKIDETMAAMAAS